MGGVEKGEDEDDCPDVRENGSVTRLILFTDSSTSFSIEFLVDPHLSRNCCRPN
jgi:hypothetical protein